MTVGEVDRPEGKAVVDSAGDLWYNHIRNGSFQGSMQTMYFEDLKLGMSVQIAPTVIEKQKMMDFAYAYNQNDVLVLTNVTEAIVKCRGV